MMRIYFRWLVIAALLTSTPTLHAKTVTLNFFDNHTAINLNVGDTLVVQLPSVPTDLHWVSHLPKLSALTALNEDAQKKDEGTQTFRYNAATPGDTTLSLAFEPISQNRPAPPITSTFAVLIHVAVGDPTASGAGLPYTLIGFYKGTLPCADCSGLDTELRLYAPGKSILVDTIFIRTQTYRGRPQGDISISDRGEWYVLRGDANDHNATVYQLAPDRPNTASYCLQNNGDLIRLDSNLRHIQSKTNLTLKRINKTPMSQSQ